MRTQRAFSIQTWDQYYFCYTAVIEYAQRNGKLSPVQWSDSDLETDSEWKTHWETEKKKTNGMANPSQSQRKEKSEEWHFRVEERLLFCHKRRDKGWSSFLALDVMMQTPTDALPSHQLMDRERWRVWEKKNTGSGDCIASLIEQAVLPISKPLFI